MQTTHSTYLLLESSVDGSESLDVGELLGELLVLDGPLVGVLAVLILVELEVLAPALDNLGQLVLHLGHVVGVLHLQVVVDPGQTGCH